MFTHFVIGVTKLIIFVSRSLFMIFLPFYVHLYGSFELLDCKFTYQALGLSRYRPFSSLSHQLTYTTSIPALHCLRSIIVSDAMFVMITLHVEISPHFLLFIAKVTEHMLEKSRVVHCGNGERSFHIFYYMFAGLSENEADRYYLSRPEHYRFVSTWHGLFWPKRTENWQRITYLKCFV
jgi:hypothetical protein